MGNSSQTRYRACDEHMQAAIFHSLFHTTVEKIPDSSGRRLKMDVGELAARTVSKPVLLRLSRQT